MNKQKATKMVLDTFGYEQNDTTKLIYTCIFNLPIKLVIFLMHQNMTIGNLALFVYLQHMYVKSLT